MRDCPMFVVTKERIGNKTVSNQDYCCGRYKKSHIIIDVGKERVIFVGTDLGTDLFKI